MTIHIQQNFDGVTVASPGIRVDRREQSPSLRRPTPPEVVREVVQVIDLLGKLEGIAIREQTTPANITREAVVLADGTDIASGFTVGAAGARPFDWLGETGLQLTEGFVTVDETLRSVNDPAIYAVGDCAHLSHAPRPKAGVFAVRAAPVLAANLRADLTGLAHKTFRPQRRYLKLVSLGGKSAIADKYALSPSGPWVWRWKDRIDRRFMDRLNHLPAMPAPPVPANAAKEVAGALAFGPMCGGCGSKVGSATLDRAIARFASDTRDDIALGAGDDAALLKIGGQSLALTTDHLRSFWEDPWLMARIAALHSLGDIWAMGAEPQALLAQIILPRMSERLQAAWLDEIMDGALSVTRASGAVIVGGHTTQGAELTLGFTATGLVSHTDLRLSHAKVGDVLILTKPIGTGVILAAEMRGLANGSDVEGALRSMASHPGETIAALHRFAHAVTDVTGFGLAGHASRLAAAAGTTAGLDLGAVRHLPGARALAAAGITSTVAPANRASLDIPLPDTPEAALLIDPQTAGGFLAAVPPDEATTLIEEIGATAIGQILPAEAASLRLL
jgi:selenide,water dikinase